MSEILAEYEKRRAGFLARRAELDAKLEPLLRRYVAALFREHEGLNALAFGAWQDYESSQLTGHAYVRQHLLEDDLWGRAEFAGECPKNTLDDDECESLEEELMRFWPTLQRQHGMGWCIAFWRDPAAPDGVATEKRDHPGFD